MNDIFAHTDSVSEEMLTKYISGKLSPAEKHEVERHLVDCEMCSDALEGLSMISDKKISSITSELNQKIQNRIEKSRLGEDPSVGGKEVKVIFLRQYRTQLAIAASIVLVLGLVWFFKANISMKEMDNATAEKMFADKFIPPAAEKDEETNTGKEQTEPDEKNPVATVQEPLSPPAEKAEKKVVAEETPSYVTGSEAKRGKDATDEKHLEENFKQEDAPLQKAEQLRKGVVPKKSEDKEDLYWRNKNSEAPKGNVSAESKVTTRDEDVLKDEVSKVTATKEEAQKNQNELSSLKEKDKKDESKKTQTISNTEVTTAAGAASSPVMQPKADKSGALAKQDAKKPADDRNRSDNNKVSLEQSGEGNVMAYESEKKSKWGGKGKKAKEVAPQKISGGYYDMQTSASAPMPETKATRQTQTEINGKLDSVSTGVVTFGSTVSASDESISANINDPMAKYDKQDYAGAANGFEEILKQNPKDEKALFYSAVSYLSLGQTEKALTNFNKILANKSSKYYEDAQWYSSLAYIKNNDSKNARMNLIPLQQNEKSKYNKQADETLKQMNK